MPPTHQRMRRDQAARPDHRAVEHGAVVGDQRLGADVHAVDHAHVRDRRTRSDVDRDARRRVQHRSVLHIRAFAHDDRRVVGTQHRVEPHRRAGLDGHVADQHRGGRDERLRVRPSGDLPSNSNRGIGHIYRRQIGLHLLHCSPAKTVTCSSWRANDWRRKVTTDTAGSGIREIDAGTLPDRYARGWHCLGPVKDYLDGEPHAVEAFGTKLVVFADSHGDLKVLDGYCRHMGGDLSQGTIKGDEVACPFHDWRWGGDGKCKLVPYAKRTPTAGPHPVVDDRRAQRAAVRLARPRGQPAGRPRCGSPRSPRSASDEWTDWRWNSILIEGVQLPRHHRQRHRHGALLLHPLRAADVLQERLRGPHRVAVPAQRRPARRRRLGDRLTARRTWIRRPRTSGRRS